MTKAFAARDSGGSFTLPPGGTGPIIDMCVLPDRVELYTVDATFMAQPPEVIVGSLPRGQWKSSRSKCADVIPYRKIGTRRRVLFEHLMAYKKAEDAKRMEALNGLTRQAQELGLGY